MNQLARVQLDVIGTFSCEVSAGSNTASAKFCVINGEGDPLLGNDTATSLGVLKIGIGVAAVSANPTTIGGLLQQKYPNVFSGVGKLKDRAVQLHIDPSVTLVAQPMLRTPFSMRSKLEEKIKELIELDIIEPSQEPTLCLGVTSVFALTCEGLTRQYGGPDTLSLLLRDYSEHTWQQGIFQT